MRRDEQGVNPISEVGFFLHAALHVVKRAFVAATESFNNFFSVDPEFRVRYYRERGTEYTRRGRYDAAATMLEKVLEEWPGDEDTLFHLGFCYLKMNRTQEGIELLERADALGRGGTRVRSILGMAFLQTKEYAKAVIVLEKALEEDAHNFHLNYRMALALDNLEKYERAVEFFTKAAAIRPDEPKVFRSLGFTLEQLGRHEDSVAQFKKAANLEEGRPAY
ncbi:MAG: tetratricopeptide repeat protein [Magnetococcales bacterium]|nr:tetratricopeptide repeat protein [Magnetococcales bacterium]